jgi:hypothetical protein
VAPSSPGSAQKKPDLPIRFRLLFDLFVVRDRQREVLALQRTVIFAEFRPGLTVSLLDNGGKKSLASRSTSLTSAGSDQAAPAAATRFSVSRTVPDPPSYRKRSARAIALS